MVADFVFLTARQQVLFIIICIGNVEDAAVHIVNEYADQLDEGVAARSMQNLRKIGCILQRHDGFAQRLGNNGFA